MILFSEPRPVAPLSLVEARQIVSQPEVAIRFDCATRAIAWAMCLAARRGQTGPVLMLIAIGGTDHSKTPEPPKDAA
jgi:hypothetical protein